MDVADSNNAEYTTDVLTQSSQFRCVVTNEAGMTTSDVAILVLGENVNLVRGKYATYIRKFNFC